MFFIVSCFLYPFPLFSFPFLPLFLLFSLFFLSSPFFLILFSIQYLIAHVGVCLHMSASTRMYIIRSVDGTKYGQVFNTVKNETFFLKYLVVSKIVSTFALAFEKSSIPQGDKERVL